MGRDDALAEGEDVLADGDSVMLMKAAGAAAGRVGRRVSVVLSGHTHAPCVIATPELAASSSSSSSSSSVLHATLSSSGWRMRPDASCALLLLHARAADGSSIAFLPLPHEHLCIAVVAAACAAVAAAACRVGRGAWRSLKRQKAS